MATSSAIGRSSPARPPRGASGIQPPFEAVVWIGVACIGAGLAFVVASRGPAFAVGALGASFVAVLFLVGDRVGLRLGALLLYIGLLDGYIKLRSGVQATTLLRDVFLYAVFGGVLLRAAITRRPLEMPPLIGWVAMVLAVVIAQVANPDIVSLKSAVAGLRPHLEFVPLFFLGYWTLRSEKALRAFLALLLFVCAVNGVVSFVQTQLTPEQYASWGPGYRDLATGGGGLDGAARTFNDRNGDVHLRPSGLGADTGFAGRLGVLAIPAGMALLSLTRRRGTRPVIALLLGLSVVAVITGQTRAGLVASVAAAALYIGLSSASGRIWATITALGVSLVVAYGAMTLVGAHTSTGTFDRYARLTPTEILQSTAQERPLAVVGDYLGRYPFGAGIGRSGPAAGFSGTANDAPNSETEFSYLIAELGIPGLLIFAGFHLMLVVLVMSRMHRVHRSVRPHIAAIGASLAAMIPLWFVTQPTANTPTSPFLWLAAGVIAFWVVDDQGASEPTLVVRPPQASGCAQVAGDL